MRGTIGMILAAVLMLPGLAAGETEQACTCAEAFNHVATGVEASYAGFPLKVDAERREAYDRLKEILRKDAAGARPERCKEVLDTYAAFFQDHHLFVLPRRQGRWTGQEGGASVDRDGGARRYRPPPCRPGPRRVALLIDGGVGSAVEGMLLMARQSPRVVLVGENTRGNIDYQQVTLNTVGCGDHAYYLGTPLYTRTRYLPEGALDGIGIAPDVPVPDHLADPLAFAVRLLADETKP
ncbi:MAG TPA: S41 family peptidase [Thermoanaerobaculia bacterium]|nr:S41 family peptidase [Thermoanaerobaculia bacterium]